MKLFNDRKIEHLRREISRANDLQEEKNFAGSLAAYRKVLGELRDAGMSSGFVLWNMAIVADYAGELETAFDYIVQAIAEDPLANSFRHSFDIIARRIRDALTHDARALDDPSTPRLYDLLVRVGEADVQCHGAMVRHLVTVGDHAHARAIADAVTLLFPDERDGWIIRAEVARLTGDSDVALECGARAAALEGEPLPFVAPDPAQG